MTEQEKMKKVINLIISVNPSLETGLEIIRFVVWHNNSKKLITDALDLICQVPTPETEDKVMRDLKRSIDQYFEGVKHDN